MHPHKPPSFTPSSPNIYKRPSRTSFLQARHPGVPTGHRAATHPLPRVSTQRLKHAWLPCRHPSLHCQWRLAKSDRWTAGRYWACMALRSAFCCWAEYVAPLVSDGSSGWFATGHHGCPSEKAETILLSTGFTESHFLGRGAWFSDRMHGLSLFALMPDDGLTTHTWPHMETLYMLPAREQ
jgi:hypothetical protein